MMVFKIKSVVSVSYELGPKKSSLSEYINLGKYAVHDRL
jgi:hypothetical protein